MNDAIATAAKPRGAVREVPTPAELLARAAALVPVLRERAARCEELRRCPDETIEDLLARDLLRICQPARFGGYEYGWDVLCEVSQVLGRGCGSQAWVANIINDHAHKLAGFDVRAQEDVWGKDPDTRISASFDPVGRARKVPGGVVYTGIRQRYSSGIDHVDWVICGGHIFEGEQPQQRCFFLIPKHEGRVIDDWHVMGLAGTGSKSFEVKEVFVPDYRIHAWSDAEEGTGPGTAVNTAPVFRMPRHDVASTGFTAIAVGMAEAFLAEYVAYTSRRKSRGAPVAALMGTQIGAGIAAAEIEAAGRAYLEPVRELMGVLARGEKPAKELRLRTKRNACYATQLVLSAVQRLFNAAGGHALFTDSAMQRQLRDIYGVGAHHGLNWDAAACNYGAHLFGIEPASP